ncbi:hypothetical protein CGCSCA5_v011086 [Colletotrichum siamense]|nr:hypothetical protein CGCSCA5_v011086 [Colletotrichum siamense]
MRFSIIALSAILGVAAAAPEPVALNYDDVVVVGEDDSYTVMKDYEYEAIKARDLQIAPRARVASAPEPSLKRRGCEESTEFQILTDDTFLNWDVPMSPVVNSVGNDVAVSVDKGYSLANSVGVTAGLSYTIPKIALGVSLSVSYTKTWTSTESQNLRFTVPEGQFGLVVSQPQVRRITGNIIEGCTDSPNYTPFTSDTYTDQSYGNLNWVKGVIRLCNSTTYPVPFCIGEGSHN